MAGRKKVIRIATREANLKRKLRRHLRSLGFTKIDGGLFQVEGHGKEVIRALHSAQRKDKLKANRAFIKKAVPELQKYFASGIDVDPARITPVLERVSSDTWQSDLFRLASLTWSVPVSNG